MSDARPRLVAEAAERLAETMFALATPSRLQILACLHDGPLSVSEIVEVVGMEQSAVSHQLRVLRDHDVVSVQRDGRKRLYALRTEHVAELLDRARPPALRGRRRRGRPPAPGDVSVATRRSAAAPSAAERATAPTSA
jgi:DNA-binding transcriptional ArsR family regulator